MKNLWNAKVSKNLASGTDIGQSVKWCVVKWCVVKWCVVKWCVVKW